MGRMGRTFAIGDIHGKAMHLERLLAHLPPLTNDDTLVFLGDYMDRGPDSAQVFDIIWSLPHKVPAKVVTLLGNHEEAWLRCLNHQSRAFAASRQRLLPGAAVNCARRRAAGNRTGGDAFVRKSGFPPELATWLSSLPLYYEDEHAIYVHAGLDGEGSLASPARQPTAQPALVCHGARLFRGYKGKRLCFGPPSPKNCRSIASWFAKILDDPTDVWFRGDLIGLDTAWQRRLSVRRRAPIVQNLHKPLAVAGFWIARWAAADFWALSRRSAFDELTRSRSRCRIFHGRCRSTTC